MACGEEKKISARQLNNNSVYKSKTTPLAVAVGMKVQLEEL